MIWVGGWQAGLLYGQLWSCFAFQSACLDTTEEKMDDTTQATCITITAQTCQVHQSSLKELCFVAVWFATFVGAGGVSGRNVSGVLSAAVGQS